MKDLRWAGHVAAMKEQTRIQRFWWGNLRDRVHLEDIGIDGIALKCS
jgi:hypothetical protein